MEIFKGRPADTTGRSEREIRTYDKLDELGYKNYKKLDK